MIHRKLAHYRIEDEIGAGGMGVVYRAQDERLHRVVALKVLPAMMFSDQERRKRFRTEAMTLSRVNHPNIATIHDFDSDDGIDFLVMEYIPGESLDVTLRRGPIAEKRIVSLATQLLEGLAEAHDRQIIHRDLKPANVRITDDGRVKILDFGLAKLAASATSADETTQELIRSQGVSGTLPYMAPEQVEGLPADARTDIHAAGVILYEMATGRRPFRGSRTTELIAAIAHTIPEPPHVVNPHVSEELSEIIMRCLEKDAGHRYQSARDLLAALRRHGNAAGPVRTRVAPARRRRMWFVAAGAAIVAAALTVWGVWIAARRIPATAEGPAIRSVAILPFRTSGGGTVSAEGLGITDTVVTKVSQLGGIIVRPTSAIRKYASGNIDPLTAGRELSVDAVLDGNLRESGNQLRVTMNLLRVSDGTSLWAEKLDVSGVDVFAVEDAVAAEIAQALRLHVTSPSALRKRYTSDPGAHADYARAMELFDRRIENTPALKESISWFQRAIARDPGYALAHANLGYAYLWVGLFVEPDDPRWLERARQQLQRATELDPSLPDTHIARSDLLWSSAEGFRIDAALRELAIAQKLDPSRGHTERAVILYHLGSDRAARQELQRSLEIDPTSSVNRYHYIEGLSLLGHHEEAIAAAKRFRRAPPIISLIAQGRLDEADRVLATTTDTRYMATHLASKAHVAARRGDNSAAASLMQRAFQLAVRGNRAYHHISYEAGAVHALNGDAAGAVKWLRETVEFGMPNYPLFARDSDFDRIRTSPEFTGFMAELQPRWAALHALAESH